MGQLFKNINHNIREYFPIARWCLAVAVTAFTAVVSVFKYIDISDMAATGFSSAETVFMILTDSVNIIFIYLPLYLFIICGILSENGLGAPEIIKSTSRYKWLLCKFITLLINTLVFFFVLLFLNIIIASRIFPYSSSWSGGFIGFRAMLGSSYYDFAYPPVPTIAFAVFSAFLMYLLCGTLSLFVSLSTEKEEAALFISLLFGIGTGVINAGIAVNNAVSQILRCGIFVLVMVIILLLCCKIAKTKDFLLQSYKGYYI